MGIGITGTATATLTTRVMAADDETAMYFMMFRYAVLERTDESRAE